MKLTRGFFTYLYPLKLPSGAEVAIFIAKKSYTISGAGLAECGEEGYPLFFGDEYFDGDDHLIKFESDLVPPKKKVDLIVHGKAYPPEGKRLPSFDISVNIGDIKRTLRIFGRRWVKYVPPKKETKKGVIYSPPIFSEPEFAMETEVSWRNAFGGVGKIKFEDKTVEFPYILNRFGKGFAPKNSPEALEGLELPLVEDPDDPITPENIVQDLGNPEKLRKPAGFGFYGRGWYPRSTYMKADGEKVIFSDDFYNAAHPAMQFDKFESCREISLINMTPDGFLKFKLPDEKPEFTLKAGKMDLKIRPKPDTIVILVEEKKVCVVWRALIEGIDGKDGIII